MNPDNASEQSRQPDDASGVIEIEIYPADETDLSGVVEIIHNEVTLPVVTNDALVEASSESELDASGVIEIEQYRIPIDNTGINMENVTSFNAETANPDTIHNTEKNSYENNESSTGTPVSTTYNEANPMATNQTPNKTTSDGSYEDWVVMPDASWPPPIFMKLNVSPRERFYLEHRWHSQWAYYDSKATQNKDAYYWYQRIVVIGSLLIPALITLNSTIARFITNLAPTLDETMVRIGVDSITVFISLAVAGSASLESLYKYGENWSSYRSAAEELQAEKNFYDMQAGPYANNPAAFATFVERIEGIVANQNGKYFQAVQKQLAKQAEDNEAILESYMGDDDDDEDGEPIYLDSTTEPPV